MREGSLDAPTRHPLDWKNPEFYDEEKVLAEMERIFARHGLPRELTRLPFVVQAGARSIDEVVDGAQGPVERGIRQAGKQHHIADVAVPAVGAPEPLRIGTIAVLCFSTHKNHIVRVKTTSR